MGVPRGYARHKSDRSKTELAFGSSYGVETGVESISSQSRFTKSRRVCAVVLSKCILIYSRVQDDKINKSDLSNIFGPSADAKIFCIRASKVKNRCLTGENAADHVRDSH